MTYEDFRDVCAIAAMKAIISANRRLSNEECAVEAFGYASAMLKLRDLFVDAERQAIDDRKAQSVLETANQIWAALRLEGSRRCWSRVDLLNLVEGASLNEKQRAITQLVGEGRIRTVQNGPEHWYEAVEPRDPGGGVP